MLDRGVFYVVCLFHDVEDAIVCLIEGCFMLFCLFQDVEEAIVCLIEGCEWEEALRMVNIILTINLFGRKICSKVIF